MNQIPRLNGAIRALEQGRPAFVTFSPADIGSAQAIGDAAYDGVVYHAGDVVAASNAAVVANPQNWTALTDAAAASGDLNLGGS